MSEPTLTEIKQACLEASKEALSLFDAFQADGEEALYAQDNTDRVLGFRAFCDNAQVVMHFVSRQAANKLVDLGGITALLDAMDGKKPAKKT